MPNLYYRTEINNDSFLYDYNEIRNETKLEQSSAKIKSKYIIAVQNKQQNIFVTEICAIRYGK